MNLDQQQELITAIGQSAIRQAPVGWETISVSMSAIGGRVTVDPVAQLSGEEAKAFDLDGAAGLACLDLHRVMYRQGTGTWYRARILIDSEGNLNADFNYDEKPYRPDQEGREDVREAMMNDHERFPRDNEHLPPWHPAKQ